MIRFSRRKLAALVACLVCAVPVAAQVNLDKYQGLFLFGEFGEVCTMCEIVVLCEAGDAAPDYEAVPESGSFTLYHLQTRTFWSQVMTIWEWFIANFDSESLAQQGHTRPVHVYAVEDGAWPASAMIVEAHVALEPPRLTFGDRVIDRENRDWLDAGEDTRLGRCQRLPLWESLDVIAQNVTEATD